MNIVAILISLVVTTIGFIIISKLPIGVEIDNLKKAFIAAVVFGILNAVLHPVLDFLAAPLVWLSFGLLRGLVTLIVNTIIFGLAAFLVQGFRLKWGVWSALIGSFALTVVNSIIFHLLPSFGG